MVLLVLYIQVLKKVFLKISSLLALSVLVAITASHTGATQAQTRLTNLTLNQIGELELIRGWKAISDDNFSWIDTNFDFSGWEEVSTLLDEQHVDALDWNGYGWFKVQIEVDSTLIGQQLKLSLKTHNGASQIYLNEKLLIQEGSFSRQKEDHVASSKTPYVVFEFDTAGVHFLSVRYSNHEAANYLKYGLKPGFLLSISRYDVNEITELAGNHYWVTVSLIGVLIAITLVHFLFLIFYPAGEKNLYFVITVSSVAVFSVIWNAGSFSTSPDFILSLQKGLYLSWLIAHIGLLKFGYSFHKNTTPKQLIIFLLLGILLIAGKLFTEYEFPILYSGFSTLVLIEFLRSLIKVQMGKKEQVSIPLWGTILFFAWVLISLVSMNDLITEKFYLIQHLFPSVFFMISLSTYLVRDFAKAQIRLEYKYLEVKHLSERSVEQERRSKAKEIEQKFLERENERKTAELEEARALQVSMLPTEIPETEFWEITAFMEPSQEVGGDYYDFSLSKSGELTIALGDATGHGMKAGIMVATAKSYFHSLVNENGNIDLIRKMSSGIKNMNVRMMYMGMTLLRCRERSIEFTSAGMPPALLYSKQNNSISEVLLKAMPLGSSIDFPYKSLDVELETGDVFVLFSDGLMELFNRKREQLGMDRIKQRLSEISSQSSESILKELIALRDHWKGKVNQEDDVTIVILKAK
ncbi:MAG: hypothetical protein ED557_01330 [Balneola sp.]|nr:MAG: hypothetical protein ED557_01330 [Balneola sp.]